MLVMRRRAGESILIGDGIEIQVLETSPGRVRLGIVAPKQISILRKEVKLTEEQNRAAARELTADAIESLLQGLRSANQSE